MTTEAPRRALLKRAWSRRWVRRLTYLLASGATLAGLTAWALQRPAVDRWIVARMDAYLRTETGLGFQAESLEVHPFQGRVILHRPALGGDLFQAALLEVDVDLRSLLSTPHLRLIRLEGPRLVLDARRLAALHLKEHPPAKEPPRFRIDRIVITDGLALVDEPAWGLDHGTFAFRAEGRGRLANQVWLDVKVPRMALGQGRNLTQGDLSLKFRATDQGIDTANLQVHLGDSALSALGSFEFPTRVVKADLKGALDLAEALRLLPRAGAPAVSGFLDAAGSVRGPVQAPTWNVTVDGRQLAAVGSPLHPGALHASAAGSPGRIRLDKAAWTSSDGRLTAEGGWTRQGGTTLELTAEGVSLVPAAVYARIGLLRGLTGRFHGAASLPSAPWAAPDLEKLKFTGSGQFLQDGQKVGSVDFTVADARLKATALELDLPEAAFQGTASATLAKRGLAGLEAQGEVATDAAQVADALRAWDVVDLDMSGPVKGRATFHWDPAAGIQLEGRAELDGPRWHGARADRVTASVSLGSDFIRIKDIDLTKGDGHGAGDIWISWAPPVEGVDGLDMCFTASRLPIAEGLKAADLGDLPITGTGSGWARLHGPLKAIVLDAQAVAEDARVYGLTVPAASGSYTLDINSLRMRAADVRAADSLDHLEGAKGSLDLSGSMDLDARAMTWRTDLRGTVDTAVLGLPGPRLQARVQGRLAGPLTARLGPSQAPEGTFALDQGRLTLEGRVLDGIQADLSYQAGHLEARAGLEGKGTPVLSVQALQTSATELAGDLTLHLGPDSAETAATASRLSQGFLKDLALDWQGHGVWNARGLHWQGELQNLLGTFEGFQLTQARPGRCRGDASGLDLALDLEGRALAGGRPSPHATGMRVSGWVPFGPGGTLDLGLEGSAELANVKAIVDHLVDPGQYSLMADLRPAGSATFNLRLGGRPAEPTLEGRLDLTGGRLSARTYPQSIEAVNVTAYFHGRDITIPQEAPLHGVLAQGTLAAWGGITWGYRGLTNYALNATVDDFQLRDLPEGLSIQGSFNGSLHGNDKDGGLLKGTLKAKSLLYQADINITDVILAGAFSSGGLSAMDPSDPLARIELDLDLQLARPWELDTNLLKLQGRPLGAFKIMGTLAHPGLKGRMDLLAGGRLTNILPAGDLVLERGSVEFPDPAVFNPILDLTGRVDVDPYLVTLMVSGTLDRLVGTPSSTPALRPDEIFAILLDPSAVTKVGGSMGAPSQSSVNTGFLNQGAGLLSSLILANGTEALRKTLGLDRVNFAILGGPNLSLTLEKSFDFLGHRLPVIGNYKQEGTQTTLSYSTEWRFGGLVLQVGFRQITGVSQVPGDTTVQGAQPSGEIRYTWTPK